MNTKIILSKICILILSIIISSFFLYKIHKGFNNNVYLMIPVLSIIIFLIVDFSINMIINKNLEHTIEKYENQDDVRGLNEVVAGDVVGDQADGPKPDDTLVDNSQGNGEVDIPQPEDNNQNTSQALAPAPSAPVSVDSMNKSDDNIAKVYPKPPLQKFQDKKLNQAQNAQNTKPDLNKYNLDDGLSEEPKLANKNSDSMLPININVSYNTNKPTSINDLNEKGISEQIFLENQMRMQPLVLVLTHILI